MGTPRSVFEESSFAGNADDASLLDQAGKVGPSKKASKPKAKKAAAPKAKKLTKAAAPKAEKPTKAAAPKAKKAAAPKAAAPKAAAPKAKKAAAPKAESPRPSAGEVATPKAKKKGVPCANEDTPAKVVANMSRKCVISRAYHKEFAASIKAGLCKEMSKENARQAHRKAADEYDANHCID